MVAAAPGRAETRVLAQDELAKWEGPAESPSGKKPCQKHVKIGLEEIMTLDSRKQKGRRRKGKEECKGQSM